MGADLKIYSIQQTYKPNETDSITFTAIAQIFDANIIEEILNECRANWHLEGECGFIGELLGEELQEILDDHEIPYKGDIQPEDFYRVSLSY